MKSRNTFLFIAFTFAAIAVFFLQLLLGSVSIPFSEVVNILSWNQTPPGQNRLPRTRCWSKAVACANARRLPAIAHPEEFRARRDA